MSENGESLPTFSLKLREKKINLEDMAGQLLTYTLRELPGHERDAYLTEIGKRMKVGTKRGSEGQIRDVAGLPALLLSMSLYDANNKRLQPALINGWPSAMQMTLFKMALELSGLNNEEADMEAAKND